MVEEGQHVLGLEDDRRSKLTTRDLAEDASDHGESVRQGHRWISLADRPPRA
jgi:hypothetical protein